jgi:predicted  nucleic acid-binding Zn-ribbon protein
MISQELIEREQSFKKKNDELSAKVEKVMNEADKCVKIGQENINRPKTAPAIALAAEVAGPKMKVKKMHSSQTLLKVEEYPDVFMGLSNQESVGSEATVRFLKAKTHVLQKELEKMVLEKKRMDNEFNALKSNLSALEQERSKEQKDLGNTLNLFEKSKLQNVELLRQADESKVETAKLRNELQMVSKMIKQTDQESHQKGLRLNRTVEELERLKHQFALKEKEWKESIEQVKKTSAGLFAETRRLAKQKQDLLHGFRKQNQLIDILKRQKVQ